MSTRWLLRSFSSWQEFCLFMSTYGAEIVLLTCLSAVTIYRREMSCNRVFHQEQEEQQQEQEHDDDSTDRTRQQQEQQQQKSNSSSSSSQKWDSFEAEEMLDGAGLYYSGAPLLSFVCIWFHALSQSFPGIGYNTSGMEFWDSDVVAEFLEHAGNYCSVHSVRCAAESFSHSSTMATRQKIRALHGLLKSRFLPKSKLQTLPPDLHVHITSYLHPKDVVTLACVDKTFQSIVDCKTTTAMAVWKNQWQRDYGWLFDSWDIGQHALKRSQCASSLSISHHGKDFYFLFGQSYMSYILAGHNTSDRCLVGIHSNIYDITPFLDRHPGSPETLMVHAGQDATDYFEDISHSLGARRLAKSLCVVVDASSESDSDSKLYPTPNTKLMVSSSSTTTTSSTGSHESIVRIPTLRESHTPSRKQQCQRGTLLHIREEFSFKKQKMAKWLEQTHASKSDIVGHVNLYYDPFRQDWGGWYTNNNLETVYTKRIAE